MLRRGMPKVWQSLFSILPKAEAAAVWMIPFLPQVLWQISVMPITVRGLTMPEAAECRGTSSSMMKAWLGFESEYSAQVPCPTCVKLTLFPTQCCISAPLASTTLPVPSKPTTVGRGTGKQNPAILILSEGLMVEASTLMRNCPSLGSGLAQSQQDGFLPYSWRTRHFWVAIGRLQDILQDKIATYLNLRLTSENIKQLCDMFALCLSFSLVFMQTVNLD